MQPPVWSNYEWHHLVHERLGEELRYYLVRVRPFDTNEIATNFQLLLRTRELEGVRAFLIFGPNDLLVRAWLHGKVAPTFPDWLTDSMVNGVELRQFVVSRTEYRDGNGGDAAGSIDTSLLDSLDDETIRAVQAGRDAALLERLIKGNVVFRREEGGPDPIKFFLAINLAQKEIKIQKDAVAEIVRHVRTSLPAIGKLSIYRGFGFCDMLVKGEVVDNFFSIGALGEWISEHLKKYGATTETHISARSGPIVETPDTISEATFKGIQGTDLFVQSVIPELYARFYSRHKEVEDLLLPMRSQMTSEHKKLTREYLLGYLQGRPPDMGTALFKYFTELEEFLRHSHGAFAGVNGLVVPQLYEKVGLSVESKKHPTLGHLLNFCSRVVTAASLSDSLTSSWQDLVDLRNKVFHGDYDYMAHWTEPLIVLAKHQMNVGRLVSLISASTGVTPQLTYVRLEP